MKAKLRRLIFRLLDLELAEEVFGDGEHMRVEVIVRLRRAGKERLGIGMTKAQRAAKENEEAFSNAFSRWKGKSK